MLCCASLHERSNKPFFFFGATVYAYASELASFDLLIVKSTMIVCISAYGRRCVLSVTVN